jgi:hypothetical protein
MKQVPDIRTIERILHTSKRTHSDGREYALINVLLDDGGEAVCVVGGECEVYLYNGQIRAHIKRRKS